MKRLLCVVAAVGALVCATLVTPSTAGATATTAAAGLSTFSPGHYTPPAGPKFNNPFAGKSGRRAVLRHVIASINSVRGYRVKSTGSCPKDPAGYPGEIKIALYSIADMSFVRSLIAASRRCVSVQLLMNDHLNASNSPTWARLVHALGSNRHARSFAYRCHNSCRGRAVLHSKFYLFSQAGRAHHVVMVGSSNITSNATRVQWNDLLTVDDDQQLYDQYRSVFEKMVPDTPRPGLLRYQAGPYESVFLPQPGANARTDDAMRLLRSIHCRGADGGAGSNGRTVVDIAMHVWTGTRGMYLARKVHQLYDQGCVVRVLYSFMWHTHYVALEHGTGARMSVRRTAFPRPGTNIAAKYSHMKAIAVSGNVGSDRSSWVVWTGSDNFSNIGVHNDEVRFRVPFRWVYRKYVNHLNYIRRTHSSAMWAIYREPRGGGRAP
jgi:hypothetical protein